MRSPSRIILFFVAGVLLISAWYAARPLTGLTRFSLPYPHEVLRSGFAEFSQILAASGRTLFSAAIGFFLAVLFGLLLALIFASSRLVRSMFFPWVTALQMTPLVVLVPLIVLWFEGPIAIVVITFLMGLFPIVAGATQGLLSVDPGLVELFHLHRAGRWREMLLLRLPASLPFVLTGAQIAATLAVLGALTGEIFAGSVTGGRGGLGYLIIIFRSEGDTAAMLAAGFMACLLGFLFVGSVYALRWRFLHKWHESLSDTSS